MEESMRNQISTRCWQVALAVTVIVFSAHVANACPFCSAASQTLSEETQAADAVVLAKLVKEATTGPANDKLGVANPNAGTATFKIAEVIRGGDVKSGQEIEVVYFGPANREQYFMISGISSGDKLDWLTPLPLSAAGVEYARKLPAVPAAG